MSVEATQRLRRRRIGEILIDHALVTEQQLEEALERQSQTSRALGSVLIEMGLLSRRQIDGILAEQRRDMPEVCGETLLELDRAVARHIPETLARRFNAVALSKEPDGMILVAMEDPYDLNALDILGTVLDGQVEPVKAPAADLALAIDRLYGKDLAAGDVLGGEESLRTISLEVEGAAGTTAEDEASTTDLMESAEDAPVVRFVEVLFREAVDKRASDVHLEPGEQTTNVRIRVDGVLQRLLTISRRMHPAVVSRIKILSGINIAERRLPQDGRCRLKSGDRDVDVRVSTLPTVHGEKVVMRLLDKSRGLRSMEELGFEEQDRQRFTEALEMPYGMVLLTGPTGSGKTTTLYGGLAHLNEPSRNIVTVEDPVEYELEGIGQVHVKPEIGLSFACCLRSILRQDPDVIMIGEMRDLETCQIAIRAALTGHLVLSTLHTNNAPAVVSRLEDVGVPPYLITASLNLVIAQRLVRRLCTKCSQPYVPPRTVMEQMGWDRVPEHARLMEPVGCPHCDYTGYRERIGLYEVMPLTAHLKRIVLSDGSEAQLVAAAREEGMRTLHEQGVSKVLEGLTSLEEVLSIPAED